MSLAQLTWPRSIQESSTKPMTIGDLASYTWKGTRYLYDSCESSVEKDWWWFSILYIGVTCTKSIYEDFRTSKSLEIICLVHTGSYFPRLPSSTRKKHLFAALFNLGSEQNRALDWPKHQQNPVCKEKSMKLILLPRLLVSKINMKKSTNPIHEYSRCI